MVDARRRKPSAARREVRQARAEAVERTGAGFRVKLGGDWLEADHLVVACEAHSGSALLAGRRRAAGGIAGHGAVQFVDDGGARLRRRRFRRARPSASASWCPKKERRRLVACTWVGTKFSHRVPEGKIVARCFLGGMGTPACWRNRTSHRRRRHRGTARDRRHHRAAALHAHLPLAALHGAIHRGPSAAAGGNRSARRRASPACTWPAMPITASAFPTASAWARPPPKRSCGSCQRAIMETRAGPNEKVNPSGNASNRPCTMPTSYPVDPERCRGAATGANCRMAMCNELRKR